MDIESSFTFLLMWFWMVWWMDQVWFFEEFVPKVKLMFYDPIMGLTGW